MTFWAISRSLPRRSSIPSTVPSNEPVPRKESSPGTSMIRLAREPSSGPTESTENGACVVVS